MFGKRLPYFFSFIVYVNRESGIQFFCKVLTFMVHRILEQSDDKIGDNMSEWLGMMDHAIEYVSYLSGFMSPR